MVSIYFGSVISLSMPLQYAGMSTVNYAMVNYSPSISVKLPAEISFVGYSTSNVSISKSSFAPTEIPMLIYNKTGSYQPSTINMAEN